MKTMRTPALARLVLATLLGCCVVGCAPGTTPTPFLCMGSDGGSLLVQSGGSGQAEPGSQVVNENGAMFYVLDGACRYFAKGPEGGEARTGTLRPEEASSLEADLALGRWGNLSGSYYSSECDGDWVLYRYGGSRLSVSPICSGRDTAQPIEFIWQRIMRQVSNAFEAGAPMDGDVRYVLVGNEEFPLGSDCLRNAPLWPLSSDPTSIALTWEQSSNLERGQGRVASGEDASRLRELMRLRRSGEIGVLHTGEFIPVHDAMGVYFKLYVRDAVPLEDANGLWRAD